MLSEWDGGAEEAGATTARLKMRRRQSLFVMPTHAVAFAIAAGRHPTPRVATLVHVAMFHFTTVHFASATVPLVYRALHHVAVLHFALLHAAPVAEMAVHLPAIPLIHRLADRRGRYCTGGKSKQ
jgi:hypothetical protein